MSNPLEQRVASAIACDVKRALARSGVDLDPEAERAVLEVALHWTAAFGEGLRGPVSLPTRSRR